MSDRKGLLAAIVAHPDEDTPRLAYADWLDENAASDATGDADRARAAYIRQRIATPDYCVDDNPSVLRYGRQWQQQDGTPPRARHHYSRGLVSVIGCPIAEYFVYAGTFMPYTPIEQLSLYGNRPNDAPATVELWIECIAHSTHFSHLKQLELSMMDLTNPCYAVLAASPMLPKVENLIIDDLHTNRANVAHAAPFLQALVTAWDTTIPPMRTSFFGLTHINNRPLNEVAAACAIDFDFAGCQPVGSEQQKQIRRRYCQNHEIAVPDGSGGPDV